MKRKKKRKTLKSKPYDPSERLRDPLFIAKALKECLEHEDMRSFSQILKSHTQATLDHLYKNFFKMSEIAEIYFDHLTPEGKKQAQRVLKKNGIV